MLHFFCKSKFLLLRLHADHAHVVAAAHKTAEQNTLMMEETMLEFYISTRLCITATKQKCSAEEKKLSHTKKGNIRC